MYPPNSADCGGDRLSRNEHENMEFFRSRRRTSRLNFSTSQSALTCVFSVVALLLIAVVSAVDYGALIVSRCQTEKGNGRCVASADSCRIVGGILGVSSIVNETIDTRNQIPFRGRRSALPVWNCLPHEICCIIPPLAQSNACSICGVVPTITARSSQSPASIRVDPASNAAVAYDSPSVDEDSSSSAVPAALAPLRLRSAAVVDEEEQQQQQQMQDNTNGLSARLGLNLASSRPKTWWCWHAALVDRHTGNVFGSAVLIAQAWLLTVAHKLRNRTPADFFVVLGERNFNRHNDDSRVALVRDIVVHPDFNLTTFANDIALLRIADAPCNGKQICTVCLGTGFDDIEQRQLQQVKPIGGVDSGGDNQQQNVEDNVVQEEQGQVQVNVVPIGDQASSSPAATAAAAPSNNLDAHSSLPSEELQSRLAPLPPLDSMYGLDREFRSLAPRRLPTYYGSNNGNNNFFNADVRPAPFGRYNAPSYWQQQRPWSLSPQMSGRSLFDNGAADFGRWSVPQYRQFLNNAFNPQHGQVLRANARQLMPLNSSEQLGSAIPPLELTFSDQQRDRIRQQVLMDLKANRNSQRQQAVDSDEHRNNGNYGRNNRNLFRELPKVFSQDQVSPTQCLCKRNIFNIASYLHIDTFLVLEKTGG